MWSVSVAEGAPQLMSPMRSRGGDVAEGAGSEEGMVLDYSRSSS